MWYFLDALFAAVLAHALYYFLSMDLYHFYIFFYVVSLILLVDALIGWATLSDDGIKIKLGLITKLNIKWADIECIEIDSIKRKVSHVGGRFSSVPPVVEEDVEVLAFTLNKDITPELQKKVKTIRNFSLTEKVAIDVRQRKLMLLEDHYIVFKTTLNAIKSFKIQCPSCDFRI
jgi:hypothetical protein